MKVSPAVPKHGDFYPTVRAWMHRLGISHLDIKANEIMVNERTARLYVKAITHGRGGPKTKLVVRVMHGAVGRGGAARITLDKNTLRTGAMSLGTVLHECAHALLNARWKAREDIRYLKLVAGKTPVGKNSVKAHGEEFCRVYARLLREVLT